MKPSPPSLKRPATKGKPARPRLAQLRVGSLPPDSPPPFETPARHIVARLSPSVDRQAFTRAHAEAYEAYARRDTEERARKLQEAQDRLSEADKAWERTLDACAAAQGTPLDRLKDAADDLEQRGFSNVELYLGWREAGGQPLAGPSPVPLYLQTDLRNAEKELKKAFCDVVALDRAFLSHLYAIEQVKRRQQLGDKDFFERLARAGQKGVTRHGGQKLDVALVAAALRKLGHSYSEIADELNRIWPPGPDDKVFDPDAVRMLLKRHGFA